MQNLALEIDEAIKERLTAIFRIVIGAVCTVCRRSDIRGAESNRG